MSFIPICNQCLSDIDGATQGLLLSCGHFICHGCCRGTKPTTCPHCGVRARAAVLDDPPAEVRDYLQNPSTQLKAANDVVMFQLDHFRAAAKQASKALHELRVIHSQEVRRREAAEQDIDDWRRRAEAAEAAAAAAAAANARGEDERRRSSTRAGGGSWGQSPRGAENTSSSSLADPGQRGKTFHDGRGSAGDGASPIRDLRRRFFGARAGEQGTAGAGAGALASVTSTMSSSYRSEGQLAGGVGGGDGGKRGHARLEERVRSPARNERQRSSSSVASVATAPGGRSAMERATQPQRRSTGQQQPQRQQQLELPRSASAAEGERFGGVLSPQSSSVSGTPRRSRPLPQGGDGGARGNRKPDAPRLSVSPGPARQKATAEGLQAFSRQQQQQQQHQPHPQRQGRGVSAAAARRPETPGRPSRPAWQKSNSNGSDGGRGSGGGDRTSTGGTRMQNSGGGQEILSPLAQHVPQQRRLQRPMGAQAHPAGGCSGGGGGQSGLYPSAAPPRQARAGTETESSSRRMRAGSLPGQPRSPAPRSPLLAARPGTLKRPASGSLPAPKRQGPASAGDRDRGTSCGRRAGTSTPILRASSPLVQIRSTQLPFTPNSSSRPGSGQRPRKTSG
ncbi:unnamed protein product, partial [Scytosiphon promiscuus]